MDVWVDAAKIRSRQIESGDDITFCEIFVPYYISLLKERSIGNVLDVGCGTGHLLKFLSGHFCKGFGVELSKSMYLEARSTLQGVSNVQLVRSDISDFTCSLRFDLIISHMCAHTVDDLDGFLVSISRFLNVGCSFSLTIPHPYFYEKSKGYRFKNYNEDDFKLVQLSVGSDSNNIIKNIPYWHRPVERYIRSIIASGMIIKDFQEIIPSFKIQSKYNEPWAGPKYIVINCTK